MPVFRVSLIPLFGVASLVAILAGCWTASESGMAIAICARMIGAWTVGLAIALGLARTRRFGSERAALMASGIILLLLIASLIDAGLQGVHRWIVLGPVRINVAAATMPLLLVMLRGERWAPVVMVLVMLILVAQPDVSQATGFALAAASLVWAEKRGERIAIVAALLMLAAISWFRPDPLPGVLEVEGIVALAWHRAPIVAVGAVAALAIACAAPLVARGRSGDPAAVAVGLYMFVTAVAPVLGEFPVPLIGISISPVIGFWVSVGLLARSGSAMAGK
ncbi:hypothetical protein AB5I39_14475 [Sphingomonas sp. MMS24-J45]|uniref:hypothetical protein n=1 Tax=Sphingomonas sp. MMS24-J45 TaxID=3238806 RepID=UPI00384C6783